MVSLLRCFCRVVCLRSRKHEAVDENPSWESGEDALVLQRPDTPVTVTSSTQRIGTMREAKSKRSALLSKTTRKRVTREMTQAKNFQVPQIDHREPIVEYCDTWIGASDESCLPQDPPLLCIPANANQLDLSESIVRDSSHNPKITIASRPSQGTGFHPSNIGYGESAAEALLQVPDMKIGNNLRNTQQLQSECLKSEHQGHDLVHTPKETKPRPLYKYPLGSSSSDLIDDYSSARETIETSLTPSSIFCSPCQISSARHDASSNALDDDLHSVPRVDAKQNLSTPDLRFKSEEHAEEYVIPDWRKRLSESRKATKSAPVLSAQKFPAPESAPTKTVPATLAQQSSPFQITSLSPDPEPALGQSCLSSEQGPTVAIVPSVLPGRQPSPDPLMILNLDTGLMEPITETIPQHDVEKLSSLGFRGRFQRSRPMIEENDIGSADTNIYCVLQRQLDGTVDMKSPETLDSTQSTIEATIAQITIPDRKPSSKYSRRTSSEHLSRKLSYHMSLSHRNSKQHGRDYSGGSLRASSGAWMYSFQEEYQECLLNGRFDSSSEDSLPKKCLTMEMAPALRESRSVKPRQSRFIEHLEDEFEAHPATTHIGRLTLAKGYDGTEDHPVGRRRGYGFDVIARENQEAAHLWERTLQAHGSELSAGKSRASFLSTRDKNVRAKASTSSSFSYYKPTHVLPSVLRRLRSRSTDTTDIAPDLVVVRPQGHKQQSDQSPDSWTRFPSHLKMERTGSAGSGDKVSTFDFASTIEPRPNQSFPTSRRHRKAHSMTSGMKGVVQTLNNRYKHERSDVRRLGKGHRSSVSNRGVLEYPDLELLPKLTPVVVRPPRLSKDQIVENVNVPVGSEAPSSVQAGKRREAAE